MAVVNRCSIGEIEETSGKFAMAKNTLTDTQLKLDEISDPGLFERIAMAILREADWRNQHLVQTGTNLAGKTVRSPVDGITFLGQTKPPRMIAVHHTTCRRKDLKAKWLSSPSYSQTTSNSKSTSREGDLVKAIRMYAEQKKETPDLEATIIVTAYPFLVGA